MVDWLIDWLIDFIWYFVAFSFFRKNVHKIPYDLKYSINFILWLVLESETVISAESGADFTTANSFVDDIFLATTTISHFNVYALDTSQIHFSFISNIHSSDKCYKAVILHPT